ncbi:hypothetical protein F0225_17185 [Vibrio pectenicida]|uniref:Uncharacterized protein n=1 Tax=Vibrio pectenicida TaxID=62763 RepID=A0A7Y4EG53_9VIBR|nr:hypothetical protein [Vibrio pectenicida]NOH73056.1 hypothetical protein [Vibrio pectenicida]
MFYASLIIIACFNILLLVVYGLSEEPGIAYDVEYEVKHMSHDYHGKSKMQLYFHNNEFESKWVVEEIGEDHQPVYFESHSKGELKKHSRNVYTVRYNEHSSNFLENQRLPDLPISSNFYSAERYLSTRNTVEVKYRSDDYIIIISFLNGGQIMAMKRY